MGSGPDGGWRGAAALLPVTVAGLVACGGGGSTAAPADTATAGGEESSAYAEDAEDDVDTRLGELEAQLAQARRENRELRARLQQRAERGRVRVIAGGCAEQPAGAEADGGAADGGRPTLRVYGSPPSPGLDEIGPLPGPAPPAVAEAPPPGTARLPVSGVPVIPDVPVPIAPAPAAAPVEAPAPNDPAADAYRAALQHFTERRLGLALEGLRAFRRAHAGHAYADNALYWEGEVHYARRDYAQALAAFRLLVERYPRGNKVPDALLRIGRCHERMGRPRRAREVYRELRRRYPRSVAARSAPREDA
ncbi:MAG: tol-pal system protein YbgF [Sandaracinaceae bacterium]